MARIDVLPSIEIIRGFKGILDFYVWRGLPCVRAWPRWRPARQTDASLAAALLFGAVIKAFALTHGAVLEQLAVEASGIPRTPRDIYVSGVYGNLHEASMSDFLTLLTECRDFLSNLTDLLHALDSIDTDEIVVNVDESVLPPLAATTTNQATAITALQKIDDLQDALESKALDRLLVRGMDQLFSIHSTYEDKVTFQSPDGNDKTIQGAAVGPNEIWVVTSICAFNDTAASTRIFLEKEAGAVQFTLQQEVGPARWVPCTYSGAIPLTEGERVQARFSGIAINDWLYFLAVGYKMTLET